jgi:hypothetical protein
MKRILLKELLNLTEQAPQPPSMPPAPGAPISAPAPATPKAPAPDEGPSPEDPGEYDFTKDFRAFESSVEKAKQVSKKKFLDKLNQMVKDKKVTVNASRGFGQPQKDYTIDKVLKASLDWAYNKNVVTLHDENDKEYILTPGVNIKIEQSVAEPAAAPEEQPQDNVPTEPPKPAAGGPLAGAPQPESPEGQPPTGTGAEQPAPETPEEPAGQPGVEQPAVPGQQPAPDKNAELDALKKKKKVTAPATVSEELANTNTEVDKNEVQNAVGTIFNTFIPNSRGRFDVRPYIKKSALNTGKYGEYDSGWSAEYTIEIPQSVFGGPLDEREFKLEVQDFLRTYQGPGQSYSKGGVNIKKHGKYYVFEFWENGGLDV